MLKYLRMGNKRTKAIWLVIIVATVASFMLGFVAIAAFMHEGPRSTNDIGSVNGHPISRAEYQNAIAEQREAFTRQNGADPDAEEERAIEMQAWRNVVTQRLVGDMARKMGLEATDREVVLALESAPPAQLITAPAFQTNGRFDPQKYVAALRDPNNNWAPFEAQTRDQLPLRKFQERIVASLKLSEPELREAFRDRYEHVGVTVLQIPPSQQPNVATPSDAEVAKTYAKYKSRFASGPRTQLEMLQIPMRFSAEEIRAAREQAQSLAERARRGEDFAQLAKDNSEGPGASKGGEIPRLFQPHEFGQALEAQMASIPKGGISNPVQDGPYFVVLKVLDRIADPVSPIPSMRVAQIAIRIRPTDQSRQEQYQAAKKIRDRAAQVGLGKAAAENGMATSRTAFYDYNNPPQQLVAAPAAAEWGLGAKPGAVSPVYEDLAVFTIVQVAEQKPGGDPPQSEIADQIKQLAQLETRVQISKPQADQAGKMIAGGAKIEDVAKQLKLTTFTVPSMTRAQPDPRLGNFPEVVGAAFASPPGRTLGPIQTLGGWYYVRVDSHVAPTEAQFDSTRAQLTQEVMTRRQQQFFNSWLAETRARTKVKDFRADLGM
jgi:peptidyl-prolyl cis-trans isomerase D